MNEKDTKEMFMNSYYAINISPSLSEEHEPMVSKEDWIKANTKLMDDWAKRNGLSS